MNIQNQVVNPGGYGTCNAWSDFLVHVLNAEGIAGAKICTIEADLANPAYDSSKQPPGAAYYQVDGICNSMPAQGPVQNPKVEFDDNDTNGGFKQTGLHAVVVIQGASYQLSANSIFDPSFGQRFDGQQTLAQAEQMWEDKMLWGFKLFALNQQGVVLGEKAIPHVRGQRQTSFSF